MTTDEAAARLGLKPGSVVRHILRGNLPATKYGPGRRGVWEISEEDLAAFIETRRGKGWPVDAYTHRKPRRPTLAPPGAPPEECHVRYD